MDIPPSQKVPEVVHTYLAQISQFLQETERIGLIKRVTGPSVYTRGKNWSTLFNVYPSAKDGGSEVFEHLIRIARGIATNLAVANGEIISQRWDKARFTIRGTPILRFSEVTFSSVTTINQSVLPIFESFRRKKQMIASHGSVSTWIFWKKGNCPTYLQVSL